MNILKLLWRNRMERQALAQIWARLPTLEELETPVVKEDTNVYRVALPDQELVNITLLDTEHRFGFRRSLLELFGLGRRIFVVDPSPGALYSKQSVVVVTSGFNQDIDYIAVAPGPIEINQQVFPILDQVSLYPMMAHKSALSIELGHAFGFAPNRIDDVVTEPVEGPFGGEWPETDVVLEDDDGDDPNDADPPDIFGEEIDATSPVYLFYGICFQGFAKLDKFKLRSDPLWDQTKELTKAFQLRGYRCKTGLAGHHGPSQPPVDTFNMMMLSLERDIPITYCNSTRDQLVLFVSAHGYGGKYNPTGKVAMKYHTLSGKTTEWITHEAFWTRLQQVGAIRRNPQKVRVIVHSCRSGGLFDHRPQALAQTGLYTSTPTDKVLCYASFITCLRQAVRNPKIKSWAQLFKEVKKCLKKAYPKSHPQPKNG